ncbi:MAG: M14 family zinc carboxypeptidase [Nitrososphaeria archaeon]
MNLARLPKIFILIMIFLASLIIPFHQIFYEPSLQENIVEFSIEYDYIIKVIGKHSQDNLQNFGICGYSVASKPIYYYSIGQGNKNIMIIGGLHGDELKAVYACLELIERLSRNDSLLKTYNFIVIPLCNPDGALKRSRLNLNNVDLNRDFYTLSQPETNAIEKVFFEKQPIMLIDVHQSMGNLPLIIYANNNKTIGLARFLASNNNILAVMATNVGQSANFAEREKVYGIIVELPFISWKYGNGTDVLWQIIQSFEAYQKVSDGIR